MPAAWHRRTPHKRICACCVYPPLAKLWQVAFTARIIATIRAVNVTCWSCFWYCASTFRTKKAGTTRWNAGIFLQKNLRLLCYPPLAKLYEVVFTTRIIATILAVNVTCWSFFGTVLRLFKPKR